MVEMELLKDLKILKILNEKPNASLSANNLKRIIEGKTNKENIDGRDYMMILRKLKNNGLIRIESRNNRRCKWQITQEGINNIEDNPLTKIYRR